MDLYGITTTIYIPIIFINGLLLKLYQTTDIDSSTTHKYIKSSQEKHTPTWIIISWLACYSLLAHARIGLFMIQLGSHLAVVITFVLGESLATWLTTTKPTKSTHYSRNRLFSSD